MKLLDSILRGDAIDEERKKGRLLDNLVRKGSSYADLDGSGSRTATI